MSRKPAWRLAAVALVLGLRLATADAGQACHDTPLDALSASRGMTLAAATAQALDASGATVVLLARAGQDLSAYGLSYSHLGFAYRVSTDGHPGWRVLHKLNRCGTADAGLWRQGLGDFFLDRPDRYDAAFVVLAPELQARLLPLLQDDRRATTLDEPRYSMVAYAWSDTYQQSNQWALETLALAAEPTIASRRQAQAWLQFKGYVPSTLALGPLTRLGARATRANIRFDDHPAAKRFSDRIETVTVDSIYAWLPRAALGGAPVAVR